jgi:adenosylcobinamide-GDP ribazoletransferase
MADFLLAAVIAVSFFTIVPMPMVEWTGKRMRFVPLFLPLVGAIVGAGGWGLFLLLGAAPVGNLLKAGAMTLYYLLITGGVHADGLMDSADAYFSRRPRERKLEIMKDSNVGAFAVMAIAALLLAKVALFDELFSAAAGMAWPLLFIPFLSRCLQPLALYVFPYAKGEGLTKMYGDHLDRRLALVSALAFAAGSAGLALLSGPLMLAVPGVALLYWIFYYFSTRKQFGGITGDLLGAYLEISEALMLAAYAVVAAAQLAASKGPVG